MNTQQNRYAEVLAPAVCEGLDQLQQGFPSGPDPTVRLYKCMLPILEAVKDIAWEDTGLSDHVRGEEKSDLPPRAYGERLLAFAFDDAYKIIKYGAAYAKTKGLSEPAAINAVLVKGRRGLLQASLLADKQKTKLLLLMEQPNLRGRAVGLPDFEQVFQLTGEEESRQLAWSDEVTEWMKAELSPGQGCPAYGMHVESTHGTQRLLYYFWDTLVAAAYPKQ